MILIDSSAWIEFLRDTNSAACNEVDRLLGDEIAVCDAVVMEVLAGARDDAHLRALRGLLARATMVSTVSTDYDDAAAMYRTCRRQGETVRSLIDCLIAAVSIRVETPLLHADADYDVLGRLTPLEIHAA